MRAEATVLAPQDSPLADGKHVYGVLPTSSPTLAAPLTHTPAVALTTA